MNTQFVDTVAQILEVDPGVLAVSSSSNTIDSWDSMRHWTLISELEAAYNVEFTMDEAAGFEVLGDIHRHLIARGRIASQQRIEASLDAYPRTSLAVSYVTKRFGFLRKGLEASWALDGETWAARAEDIFDVLWHQAGETEVGFREALDGFCKLSLEYLKLQAELRRTGQYHFTTFEEARTAVYDNPGVMEQYYLHGVLSSAVFWRNHYEVLKLWEESFLPRVAASGGHNVEVGPGHGLFTARLLEAGPGWWTTAVDISPHSRAYAERTLIHRGVDPSRWTLQSRDINDLPFEDGSVDNVVCGELLEHVEDPTHALGELRRITKPGGRGWMTTAVYSANLDHIHLFHTVEEVRDMIKAAGWRIETERIIPIEDTAWKPGMRDVPFTYASILR